MKSQNLEDSEKQQEFWLSGPVAGVPALLQPVAHALLQSRREIRQQLESFNERGLWEMPSGVASVGFHLQHIAGVIDRMLTYAEGKALSSSQLKYLSEEGLDATAPSLKVLLEQLDNTIDSAVLTLQRFQNSILTEARTVGRKKLPSTIIGLLFHAAEHTMRHTGQLIVTARVLAS